MEKEKFHFNITENRDLERKFQNLKNIDEEYVFYYDETNNIRKFWFKDENGLNIPIDDLSKNFVVGGLLHLKKDTNIDINVLKEQLKLQKTITEIKLDHIAKGDFVACLKSKKLKIFLDWLESSNLYIHSSSINILYWSLVDIIDSIIDEGHYGISLELKTILFELSKINLKSFLQILYDYDYPNIKKSRSKSFLQKLVIYIKNYRSTFIKQYPEIDFILIDIILLSLENVNEKDLTFIMNETDHVLIDGLFQFYLRPLGIFKNSYHIFDEEYEIQNIFNGYELYDGTEKWEKYEFKNSKLDELIQFSDVIVGLLGKMHDYINNLEIHQIDRIKKNFEVIQTKNLSTLARLLLKSDKQSLAFNHSIEGLMDRKKFSMLLQQFL